MIKKLLVANRGEIACRVFRTCARLGIETVAVYSDADAEAIHVTAADQAVRIGTGPASDSYLCMDRVLAAAKSTGADAIHPGYGFLSERAEFAEACVAAGLTFVGPSGAAMRKLGSKIDAKQLAVSCEVPITPGYFETGASPEKLKEEADLIGYPVMIKASAGGGGRGMRVVRDSASVLEEIRLASEEAVRSFGDGAMMVEKLIEQPRHIEVQFVADSLGNVVCLFERECSLQRRNQKVLEEAPSPVMTADLWERMRSATVKLVKAAEYQNAGTAEFMYDSASGEFYFLEVNARLQVEHPVTEAITGLDLVELQLKVAQGESLNLSSAWLNGDRSLIKGHAIEVRLIAEDPSNGFLPSVGKILGWAAPTDPSVRFDTGYGEGSEVTPFYDSMLAKVITHGADRYSAILAMELALSDTHVLGVKTNNAFVQDVIDSEGFKKGEFDTGFLGREFGEWKTPGAPGALLNAIEVRGSEEFATSTPAWDLADSFHNARRAPMVVYEATTT